MAGLGIGALVLGYASWYTLWSKIWGDGGSLLYWITGSQRMGAPIKTSGSGSSSTAPGGTTNPSAPGTQYGLPPGAHPVGH